MKVPPSSLTQTEVQDLVALLGERLEEALYRTSEVELRCQKLERTNGELLQENARLARLVVTDPLTGLKNRSHFCEAVEAALHHAGRRGSSLSLVMLDVDSFKAYNDTFGHPAGDEALCIVADLLKTNLRSYDMAARYGGEEFILLLPESDVRDARRTAERIREALERRAWPLRPLTASLGVATTRPGIGCVTELIAAADEALYRAKRLGGDCVVHHNDPASIVAAQLPAGTITASHCPTSNSS